MSKSKHTDLVCCIVLVMVLVLTALFVNAERFGVESVSRTDMGYEERLFDATKVHTLDIEMDDWDAFLENCENEEYEACNVVIDGETYKNVALRAKGNTSLSQVKNYGNNRYSLKIEFDHYDSSTTYYGLDKLCLNNIIQDNTYMKDFLTYQMMNAFGVDSPLCSYIYITVNGEDWGLYLAVEGVEDSFLQRNYGGEIGELYKPDSQSMGGGRGNGGGFDMEQFQEDRVKDEEQASQTEDGQAMDSMTENAEQSMENTADDQDSGFDGRESDFNGQRPDFGGQGSGFDGQGSDFNGQRPDFNGQNNNMGPFADVASGGAMRGGMGRGKDGGPGGGMQSDDVSLIYTDDEYDSYSNIFDNAKTDISDEDKTRLIAALKNLNENNQIEDTVDVEEVIRYFVVHNFVVNFDSYTGSMIHNYYLYEEDGQLSMIPWDYNLAYGGFLSSSDATSIVNYPIDTPVSGGDVDSRPMLAWIFQSEEYTAMYHEFFAEFLSQYFDSGSFDALMEYTIALISPYVESDPTKFCTYEEFLSGAETLQQFCQLRAESVQGQLDGSIPTTSDEQSSDSASLIDASSINISDMGTMNNGGGPGNDGMGGGPGNGGIGGGPGNDGMGAGPGNDEIGGASENAEMENASEDAEKTDGSGNAQEEDGLEASK